MFPRRPPHSRPHPKRCTSHPADVSETFIDIDHVAEPPGPGALELLVKVTTKSGDGRLHLPRRRQQHQARRVSGLTPTIIDVATRQTPGTRAKDSDRNDTCQVLDSALAEGQLSMEEHRQRVASATTAATLGELQSLVSDLQNANAPVQTARR